MFPKMELISNWDIPSKRIEHFDVYIRGVGGVDNLDREGRYWLYYKLMDIKYFWDNFDTEMLKLYDKLILLIMNYGDTLAMAHT